MFSSARAVVDPLGSKLFSGVDKSENLIFRPGPSCLRLKPSTSKTRLGAVAVDRSSDLSMSSYSSLIPKKQSDQRSGIAVEKIEEWMRESIGEIVKGVGEAPFLLNIFSASSSLRLEKERAVPENWPQIRRRWSEGSAMPDGIVLVEEIKDGEVAEEEEDGQRTWGVLVQGRGMDCASCYLLKTCRVRGPAGFCTHFSLVRAKCFGDPAEVQLRKAWLAS
ncbi:hypothetical protein J5N97_008749 [Dioscorea zingiberensis]|uniref:DUF7804 domain-containing protein n=1 Tax=Dioscorea zingiberensis TaxID=325984 RepID=A0A9D5HL20_9LILI|nr:hypothetical protein J5N97_008749 [Dioscorea zingiberensis]